MTITCIAHGIAFFDSLRYAKFKDLHIGEVVHNIIATKIFDLYIPLQNHKIAILHKDTTYNYNNMNGNYKEKIKRNLITTYKFA